MFYHGNGKKAVKMQGESLSQEAKVRGSKGMTKLSSGLHVHTHECTYTHVPLQTCTHTYTCTEIGPSKLKSTRNNSFCPQFYGDRHTIQLLSGKASFRVNPIIHL